MAEGFLKGIWGREASHGTGILGLWGTIKRTPSNIKKAITTPIGIMKGIIAIIIAAIGYNFFIGKKRKG